MKIQTWIPGQAWNDTTYKQSLQFLTFLNRKEIGLATRHGENIFRDVLNSTLKKM